MFDHLPEGFGESQQLVEEVVTSSEAHDVDHPHPLTEEEENTDTLFITPADLLNI